ncbi:MAG: ABC transporter substrate-binding protein [Kiritimatiellia bacterium]
MRTCSILLPVTCIAVVAALALALFCRKTSSSETQLTDNPAPLLQPTIADVAHVASPRLISLSPAITEILYMLGLAPHLVGRTPACNFPEEVSAIPAVMDEKGNLSLETIADLNPDFILMPNQLASSPLHNELAKRKLNHIGVRLDSLDDIYQSVFSLGDRFNAGTIASDWLSGMEELTSGLRAECVEAIAAAGGISPGFLIVLGRIPANEKHPAQLIVAGRNCFQQGIIETLGARNVITSSVPYETISMTRVTELAPAIILEIVPSSVTSDRQSDILLSWAKYGTCPAVATGKVAILAENYALRPGPRIGLLFRDIARSIIDWAKDAQG